MITSAADERITEVRTTDDELIVAFVDGRTLSVPLVWYPRLLHASAEQRSEWRLIGEGQGVHWPQIDEDLSAAGLLRGVSGPNAARVGEAEGAVSEENKALTRRSWEIVNQGNLDLLEEVYAPDMIWHEPDQDLRGLEEGKQYYSTYLSAFPDLNVTVEDVIAEGGKVVTRWTMRGTHQGDVTELGPPTGRQIEIEGITSHRIEDGKIVEEWARYDNLGLMQQLGAIPEQQQAGS